MRKVYGLRPRFVHFVIIRKLCKSTSRAFQCGNKNYSDSVKAKRKKECMHLEMNIISALEVRDKGRCQPPQRRRAGGSSCPFVLATLAFPLLLRNASCRGLPPIHVTRGVGCICFCAFFLFKNNLWFACFYTIQISWLSMRHCSHTITPGV